MRKYTALIALAAFLASGCSTYKTQYEGFRPPEAYSNNQTVNGLSIGGEAFPDKEAAENAFGFDIRGAGILPVHLVLNNTSATGVDIVAGQTFLVDDSGKYWALIPTGAAVDRLEKSTQLGAIGEGAGKGALFGAAAGSLLGAAIGIVSGNNVASALGKGAALGAAGGAVVGGTKEGTSPDRARRIADDLRTKSLEGKDIPSGYLANGFLFFPGESTSAREIKIQLREKSSGRLMPVVLKLK